MDAPNLIEVLQSMGAGRITRSRDDNYLVSCILAPWKHANGTDKNPSLSIKAVENGVSVCKCWACFPPGAMVTTLTGLRPIETIKTGDVVLSAKGRWRSVVARLDKRFTGDIVTVHASHIPEPLTATEDHRVFCVEARSCGSPGRSNRVCTSSCTKSCRRKYWRNYSVVEKRVGDLRAGDWLLVPTPAASAKGYLSVDWARFVRGGRKPAFARDIPLTREFCWLLGLYVAGGSYNRGLSFALHKVETDLAMEIDRISACLFGVRAKTYPKGDSNGIQVFVGNSVVGRLFRELCGSGAAQKHFPFELLSESDDVIAWLLEGYYAGGGLKNTYVTNIVSTVSETLAAQVRMMLIRLRKMPSTIKHPEQIVDGVVHRPSWSVQWSSRLKHDRKMFCGCGVATVKRVDREPVVDRCVYDLSVDADHSYVVGGVAVHNCDFAGTFAYMVKLANTFSGGKFAEVVARIEKLEHVDMSTRIDRAQEKINREKKQAAIDRVDFDVWDEQALKDFVGRVPKYVLKRGVPIETCKEWELGFDSKANRVVFPVRRKLDKALVGMFGRHIYNVDPVYKDYWNFRKGCYLFGEHKVVPDAKRVILVEGAFDVLRLSGFGVVNIVGLMGHAVTTERVRTLKEWGLPIYMMLDWDEAGDRGRRELRALLGGRVPIFDVPGPFGKDPGDLSKEEVLACLENSRTVL